jgi:hypothetical protein
MMAAAVAAAMMMMMMTITIRQKKIQTMIQIRLAAQIQA